MKGGIVEQPLAIAILVFVGMFVIAIVGAFYIRTLAAGPPVQVTTYTEYRWMNFLPSSALFALTHSDSSWDAMNKIALYDEKPTPQVIKHSELMGHYLGLEYFSDSESGLNSFDKDMGVVEDSFNEGSSLKREFYLVKESDGLSLIYGMDKMLSGMKQGEGMMISFPESYPYKCSQMQIPVFSSEEGKDNTRIRMVICCQQIKTCGDYMAEAGRDECDNDPCSIGPCRIVHPSGQDRSCIQNLPPKVSLSVRKEGTGAWSAVPGISLKCKSGTCEKLNIKIEAQDDSVINEAAIDFGDGSPIENPKIVKSADTFSSSPAASDMVKYEAESSHTYEKIGDYVIKCKVWDDSESFGTAEVAVKATG